MNLINKYKKLSAPLKASLWFLICSFLQKGITTITTPIFTRLFTTEQFGTYSVYQSWLGIISAIITLNLSAELYVQGLVKNEEDGNRYTSSMLGLASLTALIFFVIYLCFNSFFHSLLDLSFTLMVCMFVCILMSTTFQFWANRQRVYYKYKKLVCVTLIKTLCIPTLGILAVINSPASFKVEARVLATAFINVIFVIWIYISIFKKGKQFYNKKYWKHALALSIPLIPHYLSLIILNQSDRIMIKQIIGAGAAGIYSLAASLAFVMNILNSAISGTLNPWLYSNIKKGNLKDIAKISYWVLLILAVANLMIIIVAPEMIAIMAPPEYRSAIWVIPPIAASVFFTFMYNLFATFEYYHEKTGYVAAGSFVGAALNVALNFIFLNLFKTYENGFIAAGYTTLVCYICYALGHYFFMLRVNKAYLGGAKVYNPKIILLISSVFLALSALVTLLYPFPVIRWGLLALIGIVAFVMKKHLIAIFKKMKQKN